jgi:hypothetical protein
VLDCPAVNVAGVALKLVMVGGLPTATVALAVAVPNEFVAVNVYAVVADGFTLAEVPVTAPTPELILRVGDPVTAQLSVLDRPAVNVAGVALKLVMVGGLPTVTVALAVACPAEFVAVSM